MEVKPLKDHLEVLEKLRALEKDARLRLQKEGLSSEDQKKWALLLSQTIVAIDGVERSLGNLLEAFSATRTSQAQETK